MTSPAARVAAFLASLPVVFAASFLVVRSVGPEATALPPPAPPPSDGSGQAAAAPPVGGTASARDGYRLAVWPLVVGVTPSVELRVVVTGPGGRPVPSLRLLEGRELHLTAVRSDLTGFQHLHPGRLPDGSWTVPVSLPSGGTWRIVADLSPEGGPQRLTLGAEIDVAGPFEPAAVPPAAASDAAATAVGEIDGFEARFTVHPPTGASARRAVTATVTRGGAAVAELTPFLGHRAVLVVVRRSDGGQVHVPADAGDGATFRFDVPVEGPDTYGLYLDFMHGGVVRTAAATVALGP